MSRLFLRTRRPVPRKLSRQRRPLLFKLFLVFACYLLVIYFYGLAYSTVYLINPDNFIFQEQIRNKKYSEAFERMFGNQVLFADSVDLIQWKEFVTQNEKGPFKEKNTEALVWDIEDFVYFSTLCITGGGYGDIIPNSSITRLLIVTEIGIGVFLLIVVLNLVVMDIEMKRSIVIGGNIRNIVIVRRRGRLKIGKS